MNNDITKINAFDDVFTHVVAYLNPKEHCQTARVSKKLSLFIKNLWEQQQHNTPKNRKWLMNLYLTKIEDPTIQLKNIKEKLTQIISAQFFQLTLLPQNAVARQRIAEIGEEQLLKDLLLEIEEAVDRVIDKHQDEYLSKSRKANLQSYSKHFSLVQIKSFIEEQNDPFNRSLFQKQTQMTSQPSFAMTKKLQELGKEIELELAALMESTIPSDTEANLPQELLIPKKETRDEKLININNNEWKEDTKDNRLRWVDLLCEKTDCLAINIETFRNQMFNFSLSSIAFALPEKKVRQFKQLFDQALNNKFNLIRSVIKELLIERYCENFSVEEIKKVISLHEDPLQLSVMNLLPQIQQGIAITSQGFIMSLMREILAEMGLDATTIDALCGTV